MGVKVDLLEEIRNRLATAASSGTLTVVKRVRVGSVEEARKESDFPVINIQLNGGIEQADTPNRRFYDDMDIKVSLIDTKLAEESNSLYKTSDTTGILYVFEKLLNVLDKKTDGTVDNTFNSNAYFLRTNSYTVNESNSVIEISINISVRSKTFAQGGR